MQTVASHISYSFISYYDFFSKQKKKKKKKKNIKHKKNSSYEFLKFINQVTIKFWFGNGPHVEASLTGNQFIVSVTKFRKCFRRLWMFCSTSRLTTIFSSVTQTRTQLSRVWLEYESSEVKLSVSGV